MGFQSSTESLRRRRATCGAVLAVLGTAALGLFASPAQAATWTGRVLPGEAADVAMFGVSCPTTSLCVAVGGNNTLASSTNPTGGAESWSVAYVGQGAVPTGPKSFFNGRQIRGVSCPSPQLCVAVTFDGFVYTSTNPTGGAEAWSVADLSPSGPNTNMYGVSCPSPAFCAASAGKGKIVTSANPTGGAAAWTTTQLAGPLELRGISCDSPSLCVAVGDDGPDSRPSLASDSQILSSTNPLGGVWQQVEIPAAPGGLFGIDCPGPTLCVTGTSFGSLLLSTDPIGSASAWTLTNSGVSVQITDADCPSVSRCVAVDNNGDVLTSTNPTGGPGAWASANVIPYPQVDPGQPTPANHMFGVSCPATSLCAVSVNRGQIYTSTDPFTESPPPPAKKGKKKKRRPKRPKTEIASRPAPTQEIDGGKFPARFRFFASKRVQVRRFVCKLDGRRLKRCRSPKIYRVGLGRHVFRVRAIGWTGLKGPPEVARFRVCRDTPSTESLPPCWKGLPRPKSPPR